MRYIYLSPHPDDAVLSAGGLIYEQVHADTPVEIWTFMCGFPPEGDVPPMKLRGGFSSVREAVEKRRAEDMNAAAIVGAQLVHFDLLDCIYRRGKHGDWLYTGKVFSPPHPDEADMPANIARTIAAHLQPDDIVVSHLGIGDHVDHVTMRLAAELLGRPLLYVADIPYLLSNPGVLPAKTAGMKTSLHAVSETGLKHWQDAIAAYTSQISMLFRSQDMMRQIMHAYWSQWKGVHLWEAE